MFKIYGYKSSGVPQVGAFICNEDKTVEVISVSTKEFTTCHGHPVYEAVVKEVI